MNDLMIDIETMGNTHDSVMIQLAGIYFNRDTGALQNEFCECIDLQSCLEYGFVTDESTQKWWQEQNQDILSFILSNGKPVYDVMKSFSDFANVNHINVWSHATFDFVIVQNYLKTLKLKPMPYRGAMDIRTLVSLSGINLKKYDWKEKTHDALDDCRFQIKYCVDAMKMLT